MKITTNAVLNSIKRDYKKEKLSIKAIAKKYEIGNATAANAVKAVDLADFNRLQQERSTKNTQQRRARKHNTKQVEVAAEKLKASADTYTPKQTKAYIDALQLHVANLEDRIQTLSSLLVESDDNLVTRIYKLEGRRGAVRRFLDRF